MPTINLFPNCPIKAKNFIYTLLTLDILLSLSDILGGISQSSKYDIKNLFITAHVYNSLTILLALVTLILFCKEKKSNDLLRFYSGLRIVVNVLYFFYLVVFFFIILVGDKIEGIEEAWDHKVAYCATSAVGAVYFFVNVFWSYGMRGFANCKNVEGGERLLGEEENNA